MSVSCTREFSLTVGEPEPELSLLAYWAMEEGTGVYPKVDATGNGHDLVAGSAGPHVQVSGIVNFGLQFGSTGTGASLINTTGSTELAFDKTKGFTLCAWVYFTGTSFIMSATFPIFSNTGSPANTFRMSLGAPNPTTIRLLVSQKLGANPTETQNTDIALPSLNAWHFVRGWWDPADGLGRICIDEGAPSVASVPISLDWPGDVLPMQINLSKGSAQPAMRMDEVGYWKGLFTPVQAASVYNGGTGQTYPNLPGV